ncbi:winged helix-turn-helix domain-containing protein [Massiliimalia massiliensis]|uniref:winged helix-turn-helix domain-containing protein n=1 Tax=Massiliimalia massiliensis TaxID=1852384 RepID=UPI000985BEB1|nr:winged helix-turn-helix domain-containing protein [Massiliimalia massiliensis]
MRKTIILNLDDPDDSVYHSILLLLSTRQTDMGIEIITNPKDEMIISSELKIRQAERRAYFKDSEIALTRKEYDILLYLLQNINQVLTFTQIYEYVWKEPDYGTGQEVVSHHVRSLRRKLYLDKSSGCYLRTVRGVGYSLEKQKSCIGYPGG